MNLKRVVEGNENNTLPPLFLPSHAEHRGSSAGPSINFHLFKANIEFFRLIIHRKNKKQKNPRADYEPNDWEENKQHIYQLPQKPSSVREQGEKMEPLFSPGTGHNIYRLGGEGTRGFRLRILEGSFWVAFQGERRRYKSSLKV